jgi:hypothetical protein
MKAKNIGGITVSLDNHIAAYLEVISKKINFTPLQEIIKLRQY